MKMVVDSYSWIEIFLGTKKGEQSITAIDNADLVLTPDIVLAEISRKYYREGVRDKTIQSRLRSISESSEVIPIDETLALNVGRVYLEMTARAEKLSPGSRKPSLYDAIVLATARINDAKVLTGDLHFRDLPETIWLE